MSTISRELCTMAGNVVKLIDTIKDVNERRKLWTRYVEINNQIDKIGNIEFEENDQFYQETIDKIIYTKTLVDQFAKKQTTLVNILKELSNIIANVEAIFHGWKLKNKK